MWYYLICENDSSTLLYYFLKLFSNLIILLDEVGIIQLSEFGSVISCFLALLFALCRLMIVWEREV